MDWPSTPDGNGQVPALLILLAGDGPEAVQARYLLAAAAHLKTQNWETKTFQLVLWSDQHGAFTVPALTVTGDKHLVVFTHCGPWDDDAHARFLRWTTSVRSCPELARVPILVVHSVEPAALKKNINEKHGVYFQGVPSEEAGASPQPAPEPEPKIYIFVDDRGYEGGEPWERAAHARLIALEKKVGEVDLSGVPPFRSRPNKGFDPQKVAEKPDEFRYYPKVLEVEYPVGFDFKEKLLVASNIMVALGEVGCKPGTGVANAS
jgi:hypothetical protein